MFGLSIETPRRAAAIVAANVPGRTVGARRRKGEWSRGYDGDEMRRNVTLKAITSEDVPARRHLS